MLFILLVLTWAYFAGFINVGRNLLRGPNQVRNYYLYDNGYDAILENNDGFKVTMQAHKDEGWLVLTFDDHNSRYILDEPEGAIYSVCFEAKSNIDGARIQVSHKQPSAEASQIDFGIVRINDSWNRYSMTGKLLGVPADSQVLYLDMRLNPANTEIYIRNLQLIKGSA